MQTNLISTCRHSFAHSIPSTHVFDCAGADAKADVRGRGSPSSSSPSSSSSSELESTAMMTDTAGSRKRTQKKKKKIVMEDEEEDAIRECSSSEEEIDDEEEDICDEEDFGYVVNMTKDMSRRVEQEQMEEEDARQMAEAISRSLADMRASERIGIGASLSSGGGRDVCVNDVNGRNLIFAAITA